MRPTSPRRPLTMSFKAMVDRDIRGVFINFAEFGETRIIDGRETVIVVDQDELKRRQGGQDLAVAESGTLFYAHSDELPGRKPRGRILPLTVVSVSSTTGRRIWAWLPLFSAKTSLDRRRHCDCCTPDRYHYRLGAG